MAPFYQTVPVRSRYALSGSNWLVFSNDDTGREPNANLSLDQWKQLPLLKPLSDKLDEKQNKMELYRYGKILRSFAYDVVGNATQIRARHPTIRKILKIQNVHASTIPPADVAELADRNQEIATRLQSSGEHEYQSKPSSKQQPHVVLENGLKVSATNPITARFQRAAFERQQASNQSGQQNKVDEHTPSVFLSHAGKDSGVFAAHLHHNLCLQKFKSFFDADPDAILIGDHWEETIERNAGECDIFLCLYSEHYNRRRWCMKELDLAFKAKRRIVPVFLNGAEPPTNHADTTFFGLGSNMTKVCEEDLQRYSSNLIRLGKIQAIRRDLSQPGNSKNAEVELINTIIKELQRLTSVKASK